MEHEKTQTEEQRTEFRMTNKRFSETNKEFLAACELSEVKPTPRQASKWRQKKGKAWACGRVA